MKYRGDSPVSCAISLAVGGHIERDLTVEQLRERLGGLLRLYVPPSTLPTAITNGSETLEKPEQEISRTALPRATETRFTPGTDR